MSNPVTIDLPSNLTISGVEHLHEMLERYATGTDDVVINGANVEKADTAGLQTLLAFRIALDGQHVGMQWQTPNDVIKDAAKQLGLTEHLMLQ
ncbi:hypothetical protein NBRC116494_25980 [Aurantivibrio plasticivorans]